MQLIQQNSTAHPLEFLMVDSTTGLPKTGLSPTVKLGKNGAAGVTASGAVSEIDATNLPGLYKVAGNATDTNTLGMLVLYATASGATQPGGQPMAYCIVAFNPDDAQRIGLTALPASAAPGAANGLLIAGSNAATTFATLTSTGAFTVNGSTAITSDLVSIAADALAATRLANVANDYAAQQWDVDITGSLYGDVQGKVLGGGASDFVGNGAQVSVSGVATATELAKVISTLESAGGGVYRFTSGALVNTPASSGTGLSGPYTITLTFVDASANPVPLVEFTVVGRGTQRALANGTATFGLDLGTYTVVASPVGGVMFAAQSLTVAGNTPLTIMGYTNNITPPSNPALCTVYGYAVQSDGTIAAGVKVSFTIGANAPVKTSSGDLIAYTVVNVQSDANGLIQATLIQGQLYQISAPTLKFNNKTFTPTGSTYNLATLIT